MKIMVTHDYRYTMDFRKLYCFKHSILIEE